MSDGPAHARPSVFTIPAHRSFADSLAAGLIARHGRDPMALAGGRILLPNNRAVRSVTEAFVRASGNGLVLPRLIAVGDPDLDDRIGGALDPADSSEPVSRAIDPLERQLALAAIVRRGGEGAAEAMRLAADLARSLDALTIEEVPATKLAEVAFETSELAGHWQLSLDRLQAIIAAWPTELARRGAIDLTDRRNRLLRATALRWSSKPPPGFTIAAGITTAAPAVAALLRTVSRMPGGAVVLPALALANVMSDEEWDALGPDDDGRGEESHPQYHLKLLLDRIGVARGEVDLWRGGGRAASPAVRGRAVANAMTAADFSDKWSCLPPRERRLTGIRAAELADPASEAMAIAVALRQALETPEQTAALVTPDRMLAARVSALLGRWGIDADDSAGRPLSQAPAGTLLLAIATAAAESLAPVAMLALVKHPLVGGREVSGRTGSPRRANLTDRCAGHARLPASPVSMRILATVMRRRHGPRFEPRFCRSSDCAPRSACRPSPPGCAMRRRRSPAPAPGPTLTGAWQRNWSPIWKPRPTPRLWCWMRPSGCRCFATSSMRSPFARPMAATRGSSSGACSKRDCSMPI